MAKYKAPTPQQAELNKEFLTKLAEEKANFQELNRTDFVNPFTERLLLQITAEVKGKYYADVEEQDVQEVLEMVLKFYLEENYDHETYHRIIKEAEDEAKKGNC